MRLIFGRNNVLAVRPPLREVIRCWLRGGHRLYFNGELGGLWCYECQTVWSIETSGWSGG